MQHRLVPGFGILIAIVLTIACGGGDKPSGGNSGDAKPAAASTTSPAVEGSASIAKATIEQLLLIQPNTNQTTIQLNNGQLSTPPPSISELKLSPTGNVGSLGMQAIYKLAPAAEAGLRTAWVESTLKLGTTVLSRSDKVEEMGKWGFDFPFGIEAQAPNGDYELTVKVLPNGDSKTARFKVTGASEVPAKLGPAILVSDDVLAKGTVFVTSFQARAKTDFKQTDSIQLLTSVSVSEPVPSVIVTATWKRNGQQIGEPQASIDTLYTGLRAFSFPGAKTPGDYEVTLTVPATGESTRVAFKIMPGDVTPGPIKDAGLVKGLPDKTPPEVKDFATSFNANDSISLAMSLPAVPAGRGFLDYYSATTTYEGVKVRDALFPDRRGDWLVHTYNSGFDARSVLPAGNYETTVTNPAIGEKKSLKFSVASNGAPPPTPTPRPSPTPRATAAPAATPSPASTAVR